MIHLKCDTLCELLPDLAMDIYFGLSLPEAIVWIFMLSVVHRFDGGV